MNEGFGGITSGFGGGLEAFLRFLDVGAVEVDKGVDVEAEGPFVRGIALELGRWGSGERGGLGGGNEGAVRGEGE